MEPFGLFQFLQALANVSPSKTTPEPRAETSFDSDNEGKSPPPPMPTQQEKEENPSSAKTAADFLLRHEAIATRTRKK